jgi:hypothetical protein
MKSDTLEALRKATQALNGSSPKTTVPLSQYEALLKKCAKLEVELLEFRPGV